MSWELVTSIFPGGKISRSRLGNFAFCFAKTKLYLRPSIPPPHHSPVNKNNPIKTGLFLFMEPNE